MPALTFSIMEELTQIEVIVLEHLAQGIRQGYCPSREELSRAAGLGHRGYHINKVLESLTAKGYIEVERNRARAIQLRRTADGRPFSKETRWVPLVGQIVAGRPADVAVQTDNPYAGEAIELTESLLGGHENVYALRVKGQSMIDALVDDGDTVILTATTDIHNGDMVAATVTGEDGQESRTLKYYYRENGHVRLQPANPTMEPIFCRPSQVTIEGKVVLVIRQIR
jgi:repressor LexA